MLRTLVSLLVLASSVSANQLNPIDLFEVDESGNVNIRHRVNEDSYYVIRLYDRTSEKLEIDTIALPDGYTGEYSYPAALDASRLFLFGVDEVPISAPLDSDGDGIDDYFELTTAGFSALDAGDAALDFDNDGTNNYLEYFLQSDPNDFSPLPVTVDEVMPEDGEEMVNVTRETIVRFTGKVDSATVTTDSFYVSLDGEKVPGRVVVSRTEEFATYFYDEPLPASSEYEVHVVGDAIMDENGLAVDADADLEAGGTAVYRFRTLPISRDVGTNLFGYVKDSKTLDPIEGVTVRLSAFPEVEGVTDAEGRFELVDVPSPEFFVDIDGSTVTGLPEGIMYPIVGKLFHSVSGQTTQLADDGEIFDIFLPQMSIGDFVALDENLDTEIGFGSFGLQEIAEILPDLDPEVFGRVKLTIPAGSAYQDDGTLGTLAAIVPVPPDRLPAPLPPGMNPGLVISIQAGAAGNFDVPAPITFPNLDNLPPGSKATLWSFSHDAGIFMPVGNMTVSEDGLTVSTDPGVGVLAPGWHWTSPPRNWAGGDKPKEDNPDDIEQEVVVFTRSGETRPIRLSFPPPPGAPSGGGEHEERIDPKTTVMIKHSGNFGKFYDVDGEDGIKQETFYLGQGDAAELRISRPRPVEDIFMKMNNGRPFEGDTILGATMDVTVRIRNGAGETRTTKRKYFIYHYIDNADEDRNDGKLFFPNVVGGEGLSVKREVKSNLDGAPTPEPFIDSPIAGSYSVSGSGDFDITFQPSGTGLYVIDMGFEVPKSDGPEKATLRLGLEARAAEKTTLLLNKDADGADGGFGFIDTHIKTVQNQTDVTNSTFRGIAEAAYNKVKARVKHHFDDLSGDSSKFLIISDAASGATTHEFVTVNWNTALNEVIDRDGDGKIFAGYDVADFDGDNIVDDPGEFIDFNNDGFQDDDEPGVDLDGDGEIDDPGEFIDTNRDGKPTTVNDLGVANRLDFDRALFFDQIANLENRAKLSQAQAALVMDKVFNRTPVGWNHLYPGNLFLFFPNANSDDERLEFVGDVVAHEIGHTFGLVHSDFMGLGATDIMRHNHRGAHLAWTEPTRVAALTALNGGPDPKRILTQTMRAYLRAHRNIGEEGGDVFKAGLDGCQTCREFYASIFAEMQKRNALGITSDLSGPPRVSLLDPETGLPYNSISQYESTQTFALSFGEVEADELAETKSTLSVRIENDGDDTLVIEGVSFDAGQVSPFTIEGLSIGSELEYAEFLDVTISFDPTELGDFQDFLFLDTNAGQADGISEDGVVAIELIGTGISLDPVFEHMIDGDNTNLGGVEVGSSLNWNKLLVTNSGANPLEFTVAFPGGSQGFSVSSELAMPVTLEMGESVEIPVIFEPTQVGLVRASLNFETNDPLMPSFSQRLIATGLSEGGYKEEDLDWGNDYIYTKSGSFAQRVTSSSLGHFMLDLAAETEYEVRYFDPQTGLYGQSSGVAGVAGGYTDLTRDLIIGASDDFDTDGDGLPDDVELTMGTSFTNPDTDGDGLDDFAEIKQGLDPLDGAAQPVGYMGTIGIEGLVSVLDAVTIAEGGTEIDLVLAGYRGRDPITRIEGSGVSLIDVSDPSLPIQVSRTPREPSTVRLLAADPESKTMAFVRDNELIEIFDISNPLLPVRVGSQAGLIVNDIEYLGGQLIVATREEGVTLLARDGAIIDFLPLSESVSVIEEAGSLLYTAGSGTMVVDFSDIAAPRELFAGPIPGALGVPTDAGNDLVLFGRGALASSFSFLDVSDPSAPFLIEDENTATGTISGQIGITGSGLALVPGLRDVGIQFVDYFDPASPVLVGAIDFPEAARDIVVLDGIAYVTGVTGPFARDSVMRSLNYLGADTLGQSPTVSISSPLEDLFPEVEGLQILNGTRAPIKLEVEDDVQVTRVELMVDGTVVQFDNRPPFRFYTPLFEPNSTAVLQARAIDSGLNSSVSNEILLEFVPDTFPPTLLGQSLVSGATIFAPNKITFSFSEEMDPASIDETQIELLDLGANGLPGGGDDVSVGFASATFVGFGSRLEIVPNGELPVGTYQLTVPGTAVADLAGNVYQDDVVLSFTVRPPVSEFEAESGIPTNPFAPSVNNFQIIEIEFPTTPKAFAIDWTLIDEEGNTSITTDTPSEFMGIDEESNTALFEVPRWAVTGEFVIYANTRTNVGLSELVNWDVELGVVSIVGTDAQGDDSNDPHPGNGISIQWWPGNYDGGVLKTKETVALAPGTYEISVDFGGPKDGFDFGDPKQVEVKVGELFAETFERNFAEDMITFTREFEVTEATNVFLTLTEVNEDKEYSGMVMDNVLLRRVDDESVAFADDFELSAAERRFEMQVVPVLRSTPSNPLSGNNQPWPDFPLTIMGGGFVEGDMDILFGETVVEDRELTGIPDVRFGSGFDQGPAIVLRAPEDPIPPFGPITVRTAGGTSAPLPGTLTEIDAVATVGSPSDPEKASANPNQDITIRGEGFYQGMYVFVNRNDDIPRSTKAFDVNEEGTEAKIRVPSNGKTGDVHCLGQAEGHVFLEVIP